RPPVAEQQAHLPGRDTNRDYRQAGQHWGTNHAAGSGAATGSAVFAATPRREVATLGAVTMHRCNHAPRTAKSQLLLLTGNPRRRSRNPLSLTASPLGLARSESGVLGEPLLDKPMDRCRR